MTHLSRSDADKMFSDMAEEGSGADGYHAYDDDDEDYDMDDMSGSGDHPGEIRSYTDSLLTICIDLFSLSLNNQQALTRLPSSV